jgi:hypothetical protein
MHGRRVHEHNRIDEQYPGASKRISVLYVIMAGGVMGTKFTMEIILSDQAIEAARRYDVNVCEIAIQAVHDELTKKQTLHEHIADLTPSLRNLALQEKMMEMANELFETRKELRTFILNEQRIKETKKMRLSNPVIKVFK